MKYIIFAISIAFNAVTAFGQTNNATANAESKAICLYDGKAYSLGSIISDQVGGVLICKISTATIADETIKNTNNSIYWESQPKQSK